MGDVSPQQNGTHASVRLYNTGISCSCLPIFVAILSTVSYIRWGRSSAHWGTDIGLIEKVQIFNSKGKEINYFAPDEKIRIDIVFSTSKTINWEYFSVAISIKNKEGIDLIVKTTYDEDVKFLEYNGYYKTSFELVSNLANGEYYLVVALEDRKNTATVYYEYVEGANYFKVYSDKRQFGLYDPPTQIQIIKE